MTSYIALLRGVNVGGNKMIAMSDLRERAERLGLRDARTLLQSGNLVFRSNKSPAQLEKLLEKELEGTSVFVRTPEEWGAAIAANPFPEEAKRDPGHLLVMFLKEARDAEVLTPAIVGREIARGNGRHIYLYYPDGAGRSKLTNALIEKKLGTRGTARNWNTVTKLAALTED
jgi:uncharacterized protein (DUF1697 family)